MKVVGAVLEAKASCGECLYINVVTVEITKCHTRCEVGHGRTEVSVYHH